MLRPPIGPRVGLLQVPHCSSGALWERRPRRDGRLLQGIAPVFRQGDRPGVPLSVGAGLPATRKASHAALTLVAGKPAPICRSRTAPTREKTDTPSPEGWRVSSDNLLPLS